MLHGHQTNQACVIYALKAMYTRYPYLPVHGQSCRGGTWCQWGRCEWHPGLRAPGRRERRGARTCHRCTGKTLQLSTRRIFSMCLTATRVKNSKYTPGGVEVHIHALQLQVIVALVLTGGIEPMLVSDNLPELRIYALQQSI